MKNYREQLRGLPTGMGQFWHWILIIGIALLFTLLSAPVIDLQTDQSAAWAAEQSGQGGDHGQGHGERGPHGKNDSIKGQRGGAADVKVKILSDESDDGDGDSDAPEWSKGNTEANPHMQGGGDVSDTDRPEWAKGNKEANPHMQGGGQPSEAGGKKGDMYSDLWVILRDPLTGLAVLDDNGYVQPLITLDDGTVVAIQLTEDGDIPPQYADDIQEVEFGRLSVGRSPSQVTDRALEETLAKLLAADSITQDLAGRLVVDGTSIDAPLDNLALYTALMTDDPRIQPVLEELKNIDPLSLAASLLAAAADKASSIGVDLVAYENVILGIAAMTPEDYVDYSSFDYNRNQTYSGTISYNVLQPDGSTVLVTEPILQAIFDGESYTPTDGEGITDFAQAADDALQVIEFMHTQVHEE